MSQNRQPSIPTVPVHEGWRAEQRCIALGLPGIEPLAAAVRAGLAAYMSSTPAHPASDCGWRMYSETNAALRTLLRRHRWEIQRLDGLELTSRRDPDIAIVVVAGDGNTGVPGQRVNVRRPRGDLSQLIVAKGAPVTLWGDEDPDVDLRANPWLLLHHVAADDPERGPSVRAELARPRALTPSGLVAGWHERIIIDVAAGPGGGRRQDDAPGDAGPDLDVQIGRKAAS